MDKIHYGFRLRTARLARCLTQKEIKAITALPQNSLSAIEAGQYFPNNETRTALARAVRTNKKWLDQGEGFPNLPNGVDLFNACRQPKNEDAANILLSVYFDHSEQEVACYFDETNDFFVFKLADDTFWILFPADRSEKRVKELIRLFIRSGCKYLGSWPDMGAIVCDLDPELGIRWRLIDAYTMDHLKSMFETPAIDYHKRIRLLKKLDEMLSRKDLAEKVEKFISENQDIRDSSRSRPSSNKPDPTK